MLHSEANAIPVHVSQLRQDTRSIAETPVLLVVPPEQIHVTDFVLINFGHSGEMWLQKWGRELEIVQ